jgi:hypothetical protein
MNRLAELSGIPQPRLRGACFKGTCPTPETLRKLARAMGKHHLELYTLAYEGRMGNVPDTRGEDTMELIMRELFITARELGLTPPLNRPSRIQLQKALLELGFNATDEKGYA